MDIWDFASFRVSQSKLHEHLYNSVCGHLIFLEKISGSVSWVIFPMHVSILTYYQIVFQDDCAIRHLNQQCKNVQIAVFPWQPLTWSVFFFFFSILANSIELIVKCIIVLRTEFP